MYGQWRHESFLWQSCRLRSSLFLAINRALFRFITRSFSRCCLSVICKLRWLRICRFLVFFALFAFQWVPLFCWLWPMTLLNRAALAPSWPQSWITKKLHLFFHRCHCPQMFQIHLLPSMFELMHNKLNFIHKRMHLSAIFIINVRDINPALLQQRLFLCPCIALTVTLFACPAPLSLFLHLISHLCRLFLALALPFGHLHLHSVV